MFTKKDLKPGMVVQYRCGDYAVVTQLGEGLHCLDLIYRGWMPLSSYTDSLKETTDEEDFDIVNVWEVLDGVLDGWAIGVLCNKTSELYTKRNKEELEKYLSESYKKVYDRTVEEKDKALYILAQEIKEAYSAEEIETIIDTLKTL